MLGLLCCVVCSGECERVFFARRLLAVGLVLDAGSALRSSVCVPPITDLFPCSPALINAPPYEALGGYYRAEAIMLLRRFYLSENANGACSRTLLLGDCQLTSVGNSAEPKVQGASHTQDRDPTCVPSLDSFSSPS